MSALQSLSLSATLLTTACTRNAVKHQAKRSIAAEESASGTVGSVQPHATPTTTLAVPLPKAAGEFRCSRAVKGGPAGKANN